MKCTQTVHNETDSRDKSKHAWWLTSGLLWIITNEDGCSQMAEIRPSGWDGFMYAHTIQLTIWVWILAHAGEAALLMPYAWSDKSMKSPVCYLLRQSLYQVFMLLVKSWEDFLPRQPQRPTCTGFPFHPGHLHQAHGYRPNRDFLDVASLHTECHTRWAHQ